MTPEIVLRYWFGDGADAAAVMKEKGAIWFQGGPAVDADITARFTTTVEAAASGALDVWAETPRGALALIILLDQLTRNIYRGSSRMYDADPKARALAHGLIARGLDHALTPIQRVFAYLPLEHHEDLAAQGEAVALFTRLGAEAPTLAGFVDYAEQHRDVIVRFGRFPHRNALLGRESSPEEQAYLEAGGGF